MSDISELRRGRSYVAELHAHLVFVTKYRRAVLQPTHLQRLPDIFSVICTAGGASCGGAPLDILERYIERHKAPLTHP